MGRAPCCSRALLWCQPRTRIIVPVPARHRGPCSSGSQGQGLLSWCHQGQGSLSRCWPRLGIGIAFPMPRSVSPKPRPLYPRPRSLSLFPDPCPHSWIPVPKAQVPVPIPSAVLATGPGTAPEAVLPFLSLLFCPSSGQLRLCHRCGISAAAVTACWALFNWKLSQEQKIVISTRNLRFVSHLREWGTGVAAWGLFSTWA